MRLIHFILLSCLALNTHAARFYVNANASGNGSGGSWTNAFTTIDAALAVAVDGDEIWVAQGTYKPAGGPLDPYIINRSIALYGGFAGTELLLQQRNYAVNITTIDGLANEPGNNNAKSRLFHITSLGKEVTIDGFAMTRALSVGSLANHGMAIDVPLPNTMTIRNCFISNCQGSTKGTVSLSGSAGTPLVIVNCIFESNNNVSEGAALFLEGSTNATALVDRCQFLKNTSSQLGAAIHNDLSFCEIRNSVFNQNTTSAGNNGAAAVYTRYNLRVEHCTFSANYAGTTTGSPGGIYAGAIGFFTPLIAGITYPTVEVYNSILWGNSSPQINALFSTNSNLTLQGNVIQDYGFGGNLNTNPLLACPSIGNFNLAPGSNARNAALTQHTTSNLDVYGAPRNQLGAPDIGAIEMANTNKPVVYIKKGNTILQSGRNWATAAGELGYVDMSTTAPVTFWISAGTYSKSTNNTPNTAFELCDGCDLLGGFIGTETNENQIPNNSFTILRGLNAQFPGISEWGSAVIMSIATGGSHQIRRIIFRDGGANLAGAMLSDDPPVAIMGGIAAPVSISFTQNVQFTDCRFELNLSPSYAGAIHATNVNQLSLTRCNFQSNQSGSTAGAIYISETTLTATESTFQNNTSGEGGAVSGVFANASFGDCTFMQNTTELGGAALSFADNSAVLVLRSTFHSNTAPTVLPESNATFSSLANTNVDLVSCLFYGNTGRSTVRTTGGTINVMNTTIAHNTATGAAFRVGGDAIASTLNLRNSILWNPGFTNRAYLTPLTINRSHCIIGDEAIASGNPDFLYNTDPFFISPSTGNFRVQSFSNAVNRGSNAFVLPFSPDLDGQPRIADGTVDIGAYERPNGCAPENDVCSSAQPVPFNTVVQASNRCASTGNDPISSCNANVGKTTWYSFTAPASGSATVITDNVVPDLGYSNFNMKQTIYSGNCGNLTEVECTNDLGANQGEVTTLTGLTPGLIYRIRLEGVNLQEGFFTLAVNIPAACPGDFNGDLSVNASDLLFFLSEYGESCGSSCLTDLNNDGVVNANDLILFLSYYGNTCF